MAQTPEFLHSKSMLTPGIAGAITMLITNTLHQQFELPQRWVALGLSLLLGTLVFGDRQTKLWQRGVFYLLNVLIIFSMAVGANAGAKAVTPPQPTDPMERTADPGLTGFFQDWL
jgi:hypothetical protein